MEAAAAAAGGGAGFGWGYVPVAAAPGAQHASLAAAGGEGEPPDVLELAASRASAPPLDDLYDNELLSDVTICSEDGRAVRCHRLVLVRWSEPLRRMLCGDMREARERTITLHGVDGGVLAAFLRFLYSCSCSIPTQKLVALAAMADQYDVELLQRLCMDAIRTHAANHRCCCMFYKAAKEIEQHEISQLAWQALSSGFSSLLRQHDVFVQLELEDVLRLCSRPAQAAAAAVQQQQRPPQQQPDNPDGQQPVAHEQQPHQQGSEPPLLPQVQHLHLGAGGRPDAGPGSGAAQPPPVDAHQQQQQQQPRQQQARRPEFALFLALMAWLAHDGARAQHRQALLACLDLNAMTAAELSRMRSSPHVASDPQLKEMLLDAFAARCMQHASQPVFHMAPLHGLL